MNDQSNQYQQLVANCWADEAFKQRLLDNPVETLAAEGMSVPEGVTIRVVEDSARALTLVIPAKPDVLSDDQLADVAGGKWGGQVW